MDSERFDDIDAQFKEMMVKMAKTPNVVKVMLLTGLGLHSIRV